MVEKSQGAIVRIKFVFTDKSRPAIYQNSRHTEPRQRQQ